jgi:putative phage-type endonuclease
MRILTPDQESDEWHIARKGRITASAIMKVLAGAHTKGRAEYIMNLILDLEGIGDFRDSAPWFEAGKKYEPYALGWYQVERDVDVKKTGFVLHGEYNWLGCSPDGLVDPDGNIEIKYRKTPETFEASIVKPISPAYFAQMQMQMAVCDRQWCDYLNYWRDESGHREQGHIRRVERDDGRIRELTDAAMLFWREVVTTYRQRTKKDSIEFPFDNHPANPLRRGS